MKETFTPVRPFQLSAAGTSARNTDSSVSGEIGQLLAISLCIPDSYFALGLRSGLQSFFESQRVNVNFFNRVNTHLRMDMIFLSASLSPPLTLCSLAPRPRWVFMIKNQNDRGNMPVNSHCCEDAVLFDHQPMDDVITRVKQVITSPPRYHGRCTTDALTPREWQILDYITHGIVNHQIARYLHISQKTVSRHKIEAMRKLNVTHNAALYRWCQENAHLFTSQEQTVQ